MTAPRLLIDVAKIAGNARLLTARLAGRGIGVTGITKAVLGAPEVATALLHGGTMGLGDARVENLDRLRRAGLGGSLTLIRSPMRSQTDAVVRVAARSLNTEGVVLDDLAEVAARLGRSHEVVLMVELGDLREGIAADDVVTLARHVERAPSLVLAGLGTNLACQSGVAPDQAKMDELSLLVEQVEAACGRQLEVVSGGNSANLSWALSTSDVGRVNNLRIGEAILLGTEPLHRRPIDGLHTDACTLVAEVIESVEAKPTRAWGTVGQAAFGAPPSRRPTGACRQVILAIGRQDVDPEGITPPDGMTVLGASSDHLVLDAGDHRVDVGDELSFQVGYAGLVRASTSPFVAQHLVGRAEPEALAG